MFESRQFVHPPQQLWFRMLHQAHGHLVVLGRKNAESRMAYFLLILRDRLARVNGATSNLPLAMTRQDIADHLGLTIETVSRLISSFAKRKILVVTPDGVRLLDVEKLRMMAEL